MPDLFSPEQNPEERIWSVSSLTSSIKRLFEDNFYFVNVEGEVSNCRPSSTGHIYFTLKDSDAVISAALFKGRISGCRVLPENGMQVIVTGKIDIYAPRGSYQIIVENIRPAGKGRLLEILEERKKKLASEGLFSQEHKKTLPPYPRKVAVVTSPTGAAVKDILRVLARRSAAPRIIILPAPVQGEGAAEKIAQQIRRAGAYALGDVVIVARGGGSLEDLMPFNEESVVRAVYECPLPVISGVGHEIDVTLTDLAADVRAATPSAAAELVSDRSEDLLIRARGFRRETAGILETRIEAYKNRLRKSGTDNLAKAAESRIEDAIRRCDYAFEDLKTAASEKLSIAENRLKLVKNSLMDSSPLEILKRGYARVTSNGKNITESSELKKDDNIKIHFSAGSADARITEINR